MIKISWDQGFKRTYRKKVKQDAELKDRFWEAAKIFEKDPFHPRLRTHKLTGKLEGLWAFSVSFDCRVIFNFVSKAEVLLNRYWRTQRSLLIPIKQLWTEPYCFGEIRGQNTAAAGFGAMGAGAAAGLVSDAF